MRCTTDRTTPQGATHGANGGPVRSTPIHPAALTAATAAAPQTAHTYAGLTGARAGQRTTAPTPQRWLQPWIAAALCGLAGLVPLLAHSAAPGQPSQPPPARLAHTASASTPPPLTLAQSYHPGLPLQAYWVSEKYDGVRAHWDGQQLRSRQGLPITAPAWFTQGWPRRALDGELWAGRGQFAAVQAAVAQATPNDAAWRALRYMVFDLPDHPGVFDARLPALQQRVAAIGQPWVQAAPQWRTQDHAALMAELRSRSDAGAEGLMLRRGDAPYRAGRSEDLVKLKLHDDAEAVVLAHLPGQGKYRGMTGALLVQMPSGQQFKLGSGLSDADRARPPPVGSTVTYRFNGHHPSGLPRFARYWRPREPAAATPPR